MKKIAFVTDSTAYLTPEQKEKYNITVVPLSVIFEGKAYREGEDLGTAEFYDRMAASKTLPTTSQPPVGEFVAAFERLLKDHDTVMCLLLSGQLSGTVRSAETAASMVDGNVIVVDSRIASYGIAGPLLDGAELARRGGTPEEIVALWQRAIENTTARFVLDTLDNLHKGGRIGGAAAVFGALLQIKPILTIRDGRVELFEKVRTHKRAMERILNEFHEVASQGTPLRVGVVHAQREADAIALKNQLVEQHPNIYAEVAELGPVIGVHTGPGLLALIYYPSEVVPE
jgi:DegV family protein with EDD domain